MEKLGIFESISEPLLMHGFVLIDSFVSPAGAFVKDFGNIAWIYLPEISKRGKYVRLTGSMGLAISDESKNNGLNIQEAINPINNSVLFVRLENFIELFMLGAHGAGVAFNEKDFVNELISVMDNLFPAALEYLNMPRLAQSAAITALAGVSRRDEDGKYINLVLRYANL